MLARDQFYLTLRLGLRVELNQSLVEPSLVLIVIHLHVGNFGYKFRQGLNNRVHRTVILSMVCSLFSHGENLPAKVMSSFERSSSLLSSQKLFATLGAEECGFIPTLTAAASLQSLLASSQSRQKMFHTSSRSQAPSSLGAGLGEKSHQEEG